MQHYILNKQEIYVPCDDFADELSVWIKVKKII